MKLSKEVKIGISTVLVLIMTYWGINYLKGLNVLEPKTTYKMIIDDATGMEVSTSVLVRGVKIGSVSAIKLESIKSKIEVEITINSDYDIPSDSYMQLFESSIMSATKLTIIPGTSATNYSIGDAIEYRYSPSMMQSINAISAKLFATFDKVDTLLNSVNAVLSEKNVENIGATLENLTKVSENANDMVVAQKDRLNNIMSNFESLSTSLNASTPEIKQILENMSLVTGSINQSLPEMMQQIDNILKSVQSPEGTLGKLLNNDAVYNNLDLTLKNMSLLLEDLKLNPKKYVQFSLIQRQTAEEKADAKAEKLKRKAEAKDQKKNK